MTVTFFVTCDLICLHTTNNDKLYKSDNVELVESKEIKSNKSNKIEPIQSNVITTKSNKSYKPAFLGVQEEDLAVCKEDRSGTLNESVQEFKPTVRELGILQLFEERSEENHQSGFSVRRKLKLVFRCP